MVASSGLSSEELERYRVLGSKLAAALGRRAELPKVASAATDTRLRAYTLFWKSYDHVRRVVQYLRWNEGDADDIAPSLHAGKQTRHADDSSKATPADAKPETPAPTVTPTEPAPVPAMRGGDPFGGDATK